jgi:hypothetical protein
LREALLEAAADDRAVHDAPRAGGVAVPTGERRASKSASKPGSVVTAWPAADVVVEAAVCRR